MNKTRKNLRRSVKRGGDNNNNNWRPTRTARKPYYLNSAIRDAKILKKYFIDTDTLDLSYFQNILLTGSDREKEDARRELKMFLDDLEDAKSSYKNDKKRSIGFNVLLLTFEGLMLIPATIFFPHDFLMVEGNFSATPMSHIAEDMKHKVKEIQSKVRQTKLELSVPDIIQSIKKLLIETDIETTTMNPLVFKKAANTPKAANIVERNGELVIELKNTNTSNSPRYNNNNNNNRKSYSPRMARQI